MAEVFFFLAAIGALAGAIGTVALRNPFYSVLALVVPPALARRAVPAAAGGVRRRGAGDRLRRRGDGALPVRRRLRRRRRRPDRARPARPSLRWASALFAGALFVELSIAVLGTGPDRARRGGRAATSTGFGTPAEIGRLLLTDFLLAFEVASILLLVAAVGAVILARRRTGLEDPREISVGDLMRSGSRDAARRRRRAGTMIEVGRAAAAMSIEWYLDRLGAGLLRSAPAASSSGATRW